MKEEKQNFILQFSPRTKYSHELEEEEKLYSELKLNFDPITIKIIKKHFKERLGILTKEDFVAILKNHLLAFIPNHPNRESIMVRLLSRLFGDIDLNDNGTLEWNEFTNYIVHSSNAVDKNTNNKDYRLKFYAASNYCIKSTDLTDIITYSFYIEKYNTICVVQEGKSVILFFDAKRCKKIKCTLDLKDVQKSVDLIEFSELAKKSKIRLEQEEEEKKLKRKLLKEQISKSERRISMGSYFEDERNRQLKKIKEKIRDVKVVIRDEGVKTSINKKLSVLCALFIPEFDLILVSGTNNTITAWKFNGGEIKNVNVVKDFRLHKDELRIAILIADSPQYSMVWDDQLKYLFTGEKSGKILKWDLTRPSPIIEDTFDIEMVKQKELISPKVVQTKEQKEDTKKLKEQLKQKSIRHRGKSEFLNEKDKNEAVSCLLLLSKLQLLASSYFNGYIILWDTLLKDYRKCYCDQQTGIYSMAFDPTKNLIFTCGFDHDIYVYDPYIDGSSVYKLTGHSWSINSIGVNEKESELISLDIFGNIKIWDTQRLINFQTIKLNEEFDDSSKKNHQDTSKSKKLTSNIKMLYIKKLKKIFVYGTKLLCFETDRNNCPDLADDQVICACYFDYTSKSLLSFCLRKIKIWNILTGKVRQIYDDPMGNEMTAVTVDRQVKRGFLGDNTGKIININLKNGKIIKNLTPHNTEIKFICHSMKLNVVASCSIDNVIKIHNDSELLETEVIKELSVFQFQIRSICLVDRFSRLGIGLSNGTIKFYDIEHFHYDSDLASDSASIKDEISAIAPIEDVELVIGCYTRGTCKLIVTPPSTAKFNTVYQFTSPSKGNFPVVVSAIEFNKPHYWMFLGDLLGGIQCYNIKSIYDVVDLIKKNEIRNFKQEPIITKDNVFLFNDMKIDLIWSIEAHKESIKHLHYIELEPKLIVSTSHDLRVKIFDAENGKYKDEFKQSSNKVKTIPVGIKYYLLDPFGNEEPKTEDEYFYISREQIENFQPSTNNEGDSQQIAEYSKKITEYNAKEKLWLSCRNTNVPFNMSNNWYLDLNVDKILEKEKEDYMKMFESVKKIEQITNETEIILQGTSMYSESYKPKYIEAMTDMETIKQFSRVIAERLRNVKLAVSKANLNQSKMADLTVKKKIIKSKSAAEIQTARELKTNGDQTNASNVLKELKEEEESKEKTEREESGKLNSLRNKLMPISLRRKIKKPSYPMGNVKITSLSDHFNKFKAEFQKGYSEVFLPFKLLLKNSKARRNKRSSSLKEEEEDATETNSRERRKKFSSMEIQIRRLEASEFS